MDINNFIFVGSSRLHLNWLINLTLKNNGYYIIILYLDSIQWFGDRGLHAPAAKVNSTKYHLVKQFFIHDFMNSSNDLRCKSIGKGEPCSKNEPATVCYVKLSAAHTCIY